MATRALADAFPFCHIKTTSAFASKPLCTYTKQLLCVTQNMRPDPGPVGHDTNRHATIGHLAQLSTKAYPMGT
jgi:hypothetical protein